MVSSLTRLTRDIIAGYARPVIRLTEDVTCLIDSGADTSVWTQGTDRLMDTLGDRVEKVDGEKFLLSGFGKNAEIVDVYSLKDLELRDDEGTDDKIVFKNLVLACTERPTMVADLILPATAFSHMNYKVCNIGVAYPVLEIEHEKEEYYVNPVYRTDDKDFVERVYSFANDRENHSEF